MQPGRRAYITLASLAGLGIVLIAVSGIPRFKNGSGLDGVIGGIGWFGGCLTILVFLVLLVRTIWIARKRSRQDQAPASA